MVHTEYSTLHTLQEDMEVSSMEQQGSCGMHDQWATNVTLQNSSYWTFLAQKLPLDKGSGHGPIIDEEKEEDEMSDARNAVQSIDAVLHIVADNHKSHEVASQRRHSFPSGNGLKSSVSAPALRNKSNKNRWGQSNTENSVLGSPKVPSRSVPAMLGNATWGENTHTSSSVTSSLNSLGNADRRAIVSKKPPTYTRSTSLGSSDFTTSPTGTDTCRWSIPSTSSDSLFVPRRCRES